MTVYCEGCKDVENGTPALAVGLFPQSTNLGATVTYQPACAAHAEMWWEGADWDGRAIEIRFPTPGRPEES